MKFKDIYNEVIKYFPREIDISDGYYIKGINGYMFPTLSRVWSKIEMKVGKENEWKKLMVWIIFQVAHSKAKKLWQQDREHCILKIREIDPGLIKKQYINALHEKDYKDMLREFLEKNRL